jgi:EAL domain-containing protein (putative c-di-GMP-specific phosphodiesterase class I)
MTVARPASPTSLNAFSDHAPVGHLLLLAPNFETTLRLLGELAAAGVFIEQTPPRQRRRGLRVPVGDTDWRTILQSIAAALTPRQRAQTRVALVPRGGDDRAQRVALLAARTLADLLTGYADAWLAKLLQRGGLRVHLQPLVQYPPGQVFGYECLIRGLDADGRLIAPARLFAAAARSQMTCLLDQQACRAAVATAADLGFANLRFFVNVMPTAAIDDPATHIRAALAAVQNSGLQPAQIVFELVQAETCRDRRKLAAFIQACHAAGFSVSLDDVAAGGASLLCLEDLKPDYVKFDAHLCRAAPHDPAAADLLRGVADTARRSQIVAIAKGIETEDQLRFTIDIGVPLTQGHVHARPAPTPLDADTEDQVLRQVRRTAILAV